MRARLRVLPSVPRTGRTPGASCRRCGSASTGQWVVVKRTGWDRQLLQGSHVVGCRGEVTPAGGGRRAKHSGIGRERGREKEQEVGGIG